MKTVRQMLQGKTAGVYTIGPDVPVIDSPAVGANEASNLFMITVPGALEVADMMADRRLAQVQPLSRSPQVTLLCNGNKAAQMAKADA